MRRGGDGGRVVVGFWGGWWGCWWSWCGCCCMVGEEGAAIVGEGLERFARGEEVGEGVGWEGWGGGGGVVVVIWGFGEAEGRVGL